MELQMHKEVTGEALKAVAKHQAETGLFMVFAYATYYPCGGFGDYLGVALSIRQAHSMIKDAEIYLGGYQIVNHRNMEVVESGQIGWEN